jgi:hypothetical protein
MVLLPCSNCCRSSFGFVFMNCTDSLSAFNLASGYTDQLSVGEDYPAGGSQNVLTAGQAVYPVGEVGQATDWSRFGSASIKLKISGGYVYCLAALEILYANSNVYGANGTVTIEFRKIAAGVSLPGSRIEFTSADVISWSTTRTNNFGGLTYGGGSYGIRTIPVVSQSEFGTLIVGPVDSQATMSGEWAVKVTAASPSSVVPKERRDDSGNLCASGGLTYSVDAISGQQVQGVTPVAIQAGDGAPQCTYWRYALNSIAAAAPSLSGGFSYSLEAALSGSLLVADFSSAISSDASIPYDCSDLIITYAPLACYRMPEGDIGAYGTPPTGRQFRMTVTHAAWQLLKTGNAANFSLPKPEFRTNQAFGGPAVDESYMGAGFVGRMQGWSATPSWISFGNASVEMTRL